MPKTKKKPRSGKKEAAPAKKDQYILDDAGDKVWISTVTLSDIKKACRTGQAPRKNRRELVRIPSKQNRESILTEAGRAIANKEQESMALYGGRPWTVTARVTEPKGQKPPLFRWFRGELELAVLPHLLEKIPDPPKLKGNQEYTEEDEYIPSTSLEERTVSSLSWVAWENREYAIPNVTVKWLSPDHVYFYSRKSAWEHQHKLAEQQLFLQKMIHGLGHRGQKLKPFKPTKNDAMKAGKWRFLRDGLWVVGQEEVWQQERAEWWEEELERKAAAQAALEAERKKEEATNKSSENDKKPAGKRRLTAIALYLQSNRDRYREETIKERQLAQGESTEPVNMTLRQAESELRGVWKTLSSEEQNKWKERAKQLEETMVGSTDTAVVVPQKEASMTPAASDEVAAQVQAVIQAQQAAANNGAPGGEPAPTAVSPSPPLVPMSQVEVQSERSTLVPGSKVIPESSAVPLPDKECREGNDELRKTSISLEPGSQVLSESEASNSEVATAAETQLDTSISTTSTKGIKATCVSVEPQSQASLTAPDTEVDNSAQQTTKEPQIVTTRTLEPGSRASSESDTSKRGPIQVDDTLAGIAPPPPSQPTSGSTSTAQTDGIVAIKKAPAAASSSKKRRKASLLPPKKVTSSSQFHLTPSQIELCHAAATNHFEMVMNTVKARALHSELQDGFDLLRERGRGRYDMELPAFDNPEFSFLTDLQRAAWMPIVREVLGEDVVLIHKGAFLSMPGAEGQVYHQDGPHLSTQTQRPCHAVNVFIPLVDLTIRNGPTEFCLGTHVLGHESFVKDRVFTPCVPAGTPVMFDYRLGHRGLANTSGACRPIVYCTYAGKFRDIVNFSRRRYHKIGELVEKPLTRAERAAKRRKSQSEVTDLTVETTETPKESEATAPTLEIEANAAPTRRPVPTGASEATNSTETRMQVCESEQVTAPIEPPTAQSELPPPTDSLAYGYSAADGAAAAEARMQVRESEHVAASIEPQTTRSEFPPHGDSHAFGYGAEGTQHRSHLEHGYLTAPFQAQPQVSRDPRHFQMSQQAAFDPALIDAFRLAHRLHAHQNYAGGTSAHFAQTYANPGVAMQQRPTVPSLPPSLGAALAALKSREERESRKPASPK